MIAINNPWQGKHLPLHLAITVNATVNANTIAVNMTTWDIAVSMEAQAVPLIIRKQSNWYSCVFRLKNWKTLKAAAPPLVERYPVRN